MTSLGDIEVTRLKGVGAALADKLAKLGIQSIQDLLFHLPYRYEDRTRIIPMGSLRVGDVAVVEGEVMKTDVVMGRRRSMQVTLRDDSGFLVMRFDFTGLGDSEGDFADTTFSSNIEDLVTAAAWLEEHPHEYVYPTLPLAR